MPWTPPPKSGVVISGDPAPQPPNGLPRPNPFQEMLLLAPLNDHLFAGTGKAPGKSMGIQFLVARDAQLLKEHFACLIVRSSYQSLVEIQASLLKYLCVVFPGTKYSSQDTTFRLGGADAPFGTVELAYSASSELEQARALTRLQGRSKSTLIFDEAGAIPSILEFTDQLLGVLRGDPSVPRRAIWLANPGGPAHSELKARFVDPLPEPLVHMKPQRFWSEHYQRHVVSLTANASVNPHIDWERYRREVELMARGDEELLAALLEGRWGDMGSGSFFGPMWSPRRCRNELPPDYRLADHTPAPFVAMDYGISAPTVCFLLVPMPPGLDCPKGSLHMHSELYICERQRTGPKWSRGAMLSNSEQAAILRDWLEDLGLNPRHTRILADDAIFARNGSPNGSVAGDFAQAGVKLRPAQKASTTLPDGLGMLRSRLANTRKDWSAPWLTWSAACRGWEATIPSLAMDPTRREQLAPGQIDHAADAARYGITWHAARWSSGPTNRRVW